MTVQGSLMSPQSLRRYLYVGQICFAGTHRTSSLSLGHIQGHKDSFFRRYYWTEK